MAGTSLSAPAKTPTDKFYPDFVARLKDGRSLVVEYKGSDRTPERDTDSAEKQTLGQLWEGRSNELCVFRLVTRQNMEHEIRSAVS